MGQSRFSAGRTLELMGGMLGAAAVGVLVKIGPGPEPAYSPDPVCRGGTGMNRQEILDRIREIEASLDAGPAAVDPLQSYSENLAVSAELLRELNRLQALLRKTEEPH